MDKKIFNNSRICPKGDIEANWNKAVGFIPLDKEIIIYKPDENYSYARIKVGDGVTGVQDLPFVINENKQIQPDYEQNDETTTDYIKNRPFYDSRHTVTEEMVYTPTGDPVSIDGLQCKYLAGGYDTTIPDDAIVNYNSIFDPTGESTKYQITAKEAIEQKIIIRHEQISSELDVYFTWYGVYRNGAATKITVTSVVIPAVIEGELKQIDEKFIPDTIARTEEVNELKSEIIEVKESIVQPDYEQNNPNALDYIKNRPFYTEVKEGEQIPIEITILESDSGDEGGYFAAEYKGKFTPESILTVELDGKVYENLEPFTITDGDGTALWGNPYYADQTDNGVPFIFVANYELTDSGADGYIECEIVSSNPDLSTFKISRIPQERLICDVNNIQGIIDNSNNDSLPSNSAARFSPLNSIDITTNDIVTVTFNGKVYENLKLEKYEPAGAIVAGNKSLIDSSLSDTKEPFCLVIGLDEQGNVVSGGMCGSFLTVDEYDWSDFSVSTTGGSIKIQKLDAKYLPDGLATEEYVDEKINEIELPEVPTNYITTNTNQTNLSGTKTWTASGLVFSPGNNFKYSKEYVASYGDYSNETLIDKVELNWIENFLIFSTIGKGDSNWQGDYYERSRKRVALYNKDGFNISDTHGQLNRDGIIGNTSGITIYNKKSADAVTYETEYCNKYIKYTQAIPSGIESDSYSIQLAFPTESGIIATQKWVQNNLPSNSTNLINGTGIGSVQQVADGVANGFDFTGKNSNATALDPSLTGIIPYGATGDFASAFGGKSAAIGKRSHSEGTTTVAKGKYSHTEGDNSVSLGNDSHAEGYMTTAFGEASHSEGGNTQAIGAHAHAEGDATKAFGNSSHAGGSATIAQGNCSYAGGWDSIANTSYSFVHGAGLIASVQQCKAVFGQYNTDLMGRLFEVGNGQDKNNRSNAFEVMNDGRAKISGTPVEDNDLVTVAFMKQYLKDNFATLMETYLSSNTASYDEIISD